MNTFEQYIKDNKNKMELSEVNPQIWKNIDQQMTSRPKKSALHKLTSIAASLVLGILIITLYNNIKNNYTIDDKGYLLEIKNKIARVESMKFPEIYAKDIALLVNQIYYLDKQAKPNIEYLTTMHYEADIEVLVQDYYQDKSQLLDKLIYQINRVNKNENRYRNNYENTTISI